jgi:hypothetical protein
MNAAERPGATKARHERFRQLHDHGWIHPVRLTEGGGFRRSPGNQQWQTVQGRSTPRCYSLSRLGAMLMT